MCYVCIYKYIYIYIYLFIYLFIYIYTVKLLSVKFADEEVMLKSDCPVFSDSSLSI